MKSEENLEESLLSLHHRVSVDQIHAVRIGGKCPKRATFFYVVLKLAM